MVHIKSLAVLFLVACAYPTHASLIVNGGFEDPDIPSNTFQLFDSIPGWVRTSGPPVIEIQDNVAGSPFEGDQFVEVDFYSIAQTIPTVAGQQYLLTYAYSPRPFVPASSNPVDIYWDGSLLQSITGDGGSNTMWEVQQFAVTASSSSTVLEFASADFSDIGLGGYIDAVSAVSLAPIPEPSAYITWLVMGLTIGGGYWWRRRR